MKPSHQLKFGLALLYLLTDLVMIPSPLAAQTDESAHDLQLDASLRNPTVAIVLEMPRETPTEVLTAVFTLLDLGEQRLAAKLLEPLLKEELAEADQAKLVEKFGTAKFLRLSRLDQKPTADAAHFSEARKFAQGCLKAAATKARDPARIAKLIQQLHDPQPQVRNAARVDLKVTGIDGVRACLEALAKIDRDLTADYQDQRAGLMAALVALHPAVDQPLLAALAGCDGVEGHLCRDLAEVAGYLNLSAAVPWLAKWAACSPDRPTATAAQQALAKMGISKPTPDEVRILAVREIQRLESGVSRVRTNGSGKVAWWTWDQQAGKLNAQLHRSQSVETLSAERLALILTTCGQPDFKQRQLALIYHLETLEGRDSPSRQVTPNTHGSESRAARSFSPAELSDTLAEAVRRNRITAAIYCAAALGRRGDRSVLTSRQGRPTPLAKSLQHADAELRFVALEAIMHLSSDRSFAGASHLADVLWDFAAGSGPEQAVVASPIVSRLGNWAGQLRALGYEALPAATGRQALQAAIDAPRLALVILDSDTSHPAVREIVYQLRSTSVLGSTPVAVVCGGDRLSQFTRLAEGDRHLLAAVRPASDTRLAEIVQQLKQLSYSPLATEEKRLQQSKQALGWLAELLQAEGAHRELRRRGQIAETTLYQPELVKVSLVVLTHLGTARSQLALLNYASSHALPIENRQLAADAFATSTDIYGKLLTTSQLLEQYERYNASQTADRDTQQVLGHLLDVLENSGQEAADSRKPTANSLP